MNSLFSLFINPATGDAGLSPVVIVLSIICAAIVIGCIIWTIVINRKGNKIHTTVITVTEDETNETTENTLEEIKPEDINEEE